MNKILKRLKKVVKPFLVRKNFVYLGVSVFVLVAASFGWLAVTNQNDPIPGKLAREAENTKNNIVNDVTELNPVHVSGIVVPHTIEDIVKYVKANDHVSIGGGRNSMGGQTASEKAVQIDMREYNKILDFSADKKEITVQAGARWRDIQDYIDPHNLSVKIMQTYSNFTVGGSLSVNVHGRYIGLGPMILSIEKIRMVLADGSIVEASPSKNQEIFYSTIGGMGGIGVVSDVTLSLADNVNVERTRAKMSTGEYAEFFKNNVRSNPGVVFHNGDMYPPDFEHISAVSWSATDREPTTESRLIPRRQDYWLERIAWVVMSEWPYGRAIREYIIDPLIYRGELPVHTRNYEASYDVAELEPESRDKSSYVLQEYFVPVERFDEWVPKMKKVFNDNDVNVINVSIRHAFADPGAKLAWAQKESFAFVVYYKQGTTEKDRERVGVWTRQMIDQVLSVDGRYYLPYQPHATDEQFHRAYPGAIEYFEIKKHYDPTNKFTNKLWDKYYSPEKLEFYKKERGALRTASTTSDYYRSFNNAYLAIPEWYIVYSADEYAAVLRDALPSRFSYFGAIGDFWEQYRGVISLVGDQMSASHDYQTVLRVIGVSFSLENVIKGVYENTIGAFFEGLAGNVQVPEDSYAAEVARDYAQFIYDYPWYDFPYGKSFLGVWCVSGEGEYSLGQNLRRLERKLFLSVEYGVKTLYAQAIAFATHTKFGVQDDVIYATITRDGGKSYELIKAAHYQPFTRMLLAELRKESENKDFQIVNISGNESITFTYRDKMGAPMSPLVREIFRDKEIAHVGKNTNYIDRITGEVPVKDIVSVYRDLTLKGIAIDHLYDY